MGGCGCQCHTCSLHTGSILLKKYSGLARKIHFDSLDSFISTLSLTLFVVVVVVWSGVVVPLDLHVDLNSFTCNLDLFEIN